ncbi:amino acid adenylation domain-containing protein [Chitinimonas lacunae]|uniref:Amino acid adenylation domain-containing protein n=1 Tax=Chitinimonas lacunae TaxID=1963018 RepID=A0ABV8MLR8_9NEIS
MAFVYSGVGAHWPDMARPLARRDAGFRRRLEQVDAAFAPYSDLRLTGLLLGDGKADWDDTTLSYPATFAIQLALTDYLSAHGVRPAMVLGHSAGEVAAAVAADALTLDDAARLVSAHCELMRATPPGRMLHVALDAEAVAARLRDCRGLELAAINGPGASVVAGDDDALMPLLARLEHEGVSHRLLSVSLPFHSAAVEAGLPDFMAQLTALRPRASAVPFLSSCEATVLPGQTLDGGYWARHIRQPIRFVEAATLLGRLRPGCVIEVGPHPVLAQHIANLFGAQRLLLPVLPTLHREEGVALLDDTLATLAERPAAVSDSHHASPDTPTPDTAALTATLETALAETVGRPVPLAEALETSWGELGLSSVQTVALTRALAARLGRVLPATLAYRCPTPALLLAELAAVKPTATVATPRESTGDAPVAIVGMACRFPGGANDPAAYWALLESGRDPIGPIPPERWDAAAWYHPDRAAPGKSVSRWGGFIEGQDLRDFDARLFRLTPKEASALDPQQRLLLEVCWEALENAGFPPLSLKGRRVAVYAGLSTDDYKTATLYGNDLATLDPYSAAGAMDCTAAGRLSYFFGWQGANMAVDTACSSSLVALHLAVQALRQGECELAVVAGVNALLTPHLYVYFSKAGILSPTGRCHTFSDQADGYVRAEGCAVLILERESDAAAGGRRVRARIAATALNQDGASTGFSAPNGAAQSRVIEEAWQRAACRAADIDYLEAHGTGTPIGDPIELEALAEVLQRDGSRQTPLPIGSVKSQIGHLEAAAGIASLCKVVLAMEAGRIPASLHAEPPSSRVDWSTLPLEVVTGLRPWPARQGRRVAAVSSFGFSGTNSHVVVEVPDQPMPVLAPPERPLLLVLSAPTSEALTALAGRYAAALAHTDRAAAADLLFSSHGSRQSFAERLSVWGDEPAALATALTDPASPYRRTGQGEAAGLCFLFTGQGCQYPGMARQLYDSEPVFRRSLDLAESLLQADGHPGVLAGLLDASSDAAALAQTDRAQLAIFCFEAALAELWRHWGIEPDAVVGHSIGEFAAAVSAGVLEFADALWLVRQRGELMAALPEGGAMAALPLDAASAEAAIAPYGGRLALAAFNGPQRVVVSGETDALEELLAGLGPVGRQARRLQVSHAFHSPLMSAAAEAFAQCCAEVDYQPACCHWISSVDGEDYLGRVLDPGYFARQIVAPVRFDAALGRLGQTPGYSYVEIGPAAVLSALGLERPAAPPSPDNAWLASVRRGKAAADTLAEVLATLAARGHRVDWPRYAGPGRRRVDLPPYPFQRKRHWREPVLPGGRLDADAIYRRIDHYAERRFLDLLRNHYDVLREPGRPESRAALAARVDPARLGVLDGGLAVLARAGLIALDASSLTLLPAGSGHDAGSLATERAALLGRHPRMAGTLDLIDACLDAYPAILAGRLHPTEVLFPGGEMSRVAACYADNEVQDSYNRRVADVVAARLAGHPRRERLRILEVGTGTGSTTAAVRASLPADWHGRYLCTDISRGFFPYLQARLGQDATLEFALFDLEQPAAGQGLVAGEFDLIIANNVLHATADIVACLNNLRPLLAADGCLVLHEQVQPHGFVHLVFGIAPGWHRAVDRFRRLPDSPLLDLAHWHEALVEAGFRVEPVRDEASGQAVLLAMPDPVSSSLSSIAQEAFSMADPASLASSLSLVVGLIAQLTGLAADEVDADLSLLELGLDSLMLVQLGSQLERQHGLHATLAEFYEGLETARKIAGRLAETAPAAAAVAPPLQRAAPPATAAVPAPVLHAAPAAAPVMQPAAVPLDGSLQGVLALQLDAMSRLMQQQLSLLGHSAQPVVLQAAPAVQPAVAVQALQAPVVQPTEAERPAVPNFRSLKLDEDTLDQRQRRFVTELVERYTARTPGSRRLAQDHRRVLADWKNTLSFRYSLKEMMYPIASDRTEGSRLIDVDGNEYIDITMGCGIGLLGHSPASVVEAVQAQAARSFAIGPQTPLAAEVAAQVSRLTGMERVTFCNTGAEAVMMAVRLARAVTGRRKIVVFSGAYHGTWDGVLGVEHEGRVFPTGAGIPPGMVEDLLIVNYGTEEGLEQVRTHAHELAAVLVEPVQSRRPGFQPRAFLQSLREITAKSGTALIFDEMITGFRIAAGGAQEAFGIRADMATYGKIVGGGLPLSIVAGSARFLDAVDGGDWRYGDDSRPEHEVIYFGGTYVKHPLSLAAARAGLALIESSPTLYRDLNERTRRMAERLNSFFAAESVPITLNHFGSLFRFDGNGRYAALFQPIEMDLFALLLNLQGVYIWERRICFLSVAHSDADVERIITAVEQAVAQLRAGGFAFRSPDGPPPRKRSGPASPAQRRLFALNQLEGANTAYNVPLAIALHGPLDVAALEAALQGVFRRHDALRTRFFLDEQGVRQEVVAEAGLTLERASIEPAALTARLREFMRPFELGQAPLFRAVLFELGREHHVLAMDAHHIVVDGLSLNLIATELMALYQGKSLPRPLVQALDQSETAAPSPAGADYWRRQFASLPELLALPTDFPRPARRSQRGDDCYATLDAATTARLREAARQQRLPLFPVLLAAWSLLLQKMSGQDEVVVGVPVGGRSDERFAGTVGMFAQTLPLRLAGTVQSFVEHARQCHRVFLGALEHQDYPLEELLRALELQRDLSRNPLFDVMFIMENGEDRVYRLPGLRCETLTVSRGAAMFDLSMEAVEAEGGLQLRCEYATDLFRAETARRHLDLYLDLLRALPERLGSLTTELPFLSDVGRARQLSWGRGPDWTAAPATACAGIVAQVAERGAAIALVQGETQLSYRELLGRANQLAHTLRRRVALQANDRVALLCERTPDLLIGLLAILQAGAAYVPIDPDFPPERIAAMLEDSGARMVLGDAAALGRAVLPEMLPVQRIDRPDAGASDESPVTGIGPDDLAYVIFTSGSTGRPKGVMVRHRNAAAFFGQLGTSFGFAAGHRMLALTTVSFDIAALELLGTLWHGMTVVLASSREARDPATVLALLGEQQIDTLQLTPTRLAPLLALDGDGQLDRLETLLVGGEALSPALAARLATRPGRSFGVYGPTETTIWSSACLLDAASPCLGRALPGQQLFVLDRDGELLPEGAIGEIAIGGVGVSAGYLGQPELTDGRFVYRPALAEGPLYLTGDLGRWGADGRLYYVGRNDDQIKLRGTRIEPGEIEAALRHHPEVAEAAVTLRHDSTGEALLVAYLVLRGGMANGLDEATWRHWLAGKLPETMVPARFVALERLPQTPNGKLDRRALPEPAPRRAAEGARRVPATAAEAAVLQAFSEVLGVEAGLDDDYFVLGGDSIRALRLVARLHGAGFALSLDQIFSHPQAEALARQLTPLRQTATAEPTNPAGLAADELADLFR